MTPDLQNFILMLHNQLRNKLATGKVPGYLPAAKMPILVSKYVLQLNYQIFTIKCLFIAMEQRVKLFSRIECTTM